MLHGLHGFTILFMLHGLHGLCFIAQGLAFMEHGLHGLAASATPCIKNIAKNENTKVK